jgi:hypothetical protein
MYDSLWYKKQSKIRGKSGSVLTVCSGGGRTLRKRLTGIKKANRIEYRTAGVRSPKR